MAKKNDRKEYNKLKKKKADNKKQQEQCQSEIDVLDEKIERLKAAYRKLDDAKEAIDDIKHNQRNMINSDLYQCMWTGSNAQEYYDSCESGNLYTAYDGYVSNIDAAEDAINWEINTLKEKMNENMVCFQDLLTHGMICARKYRIFSINKRERRNTKMEISLDNMQVSFMTAGIKTASDSVSLTAAETEIKSRSEAMDKFQEEYRQLKAFVKDYRDTLNNDLAKIDLIINAINENDRKQGDYIKNGIGLSDTAVIP